MRMARGCGLLAAFCRTSLWTPGQLVCVNRIFIKSSLQQPGTVASQVNGLIYFPVFCSTVDDVIEPVI